MKNTPTEWAILIWLLTAFGLVFYVALLEFIYGPRDNPLDTLPRAVAKEPAERGFNDS